MKDCICILSIKPHEIWINFLKKMYNKYNKKFDIYIIVDDNSKIYESPPEIKIIQLDDNIVKNSSFINSCICTIQKTPISWDKALYYFCKNNNYNNYWFIEDDVFIPTIDIINNLYENYVLDDVDVIVNAYHENNIYKKDWHWHNMYIKEDINKTYFSLPWYLGLVPFIRLSKKMLDLINEFVKENNRLLFIEFFFVTLALSNNLVVKQIQQLGILEWEKNYFYENKNGVISLKKHLITDKNKVYHPIKNIEDHLILRSSKINHVIYFYDDNQKMLKETFELTFKYFMPNIEMKPIKFDYKSNSSNFGTLDFKNLMIEKILKGREYIQNNFGNIILISDIDIIIYNNFEHLLNLEEEYDIIFQKENKKKNCINTGFILLRCSQKTLDLWDNVFNIFNNFKKDQFINEQEIINNIIGKSNLKWKLFDDKIWAFSNNPMPSNLYLHHANVTKKNSNKTSLELKVIQIENILQKFNHPLKEKIIYILNNVS